MVSLCYNTGIINHKCDGFRTSHEINKVEILTTEDLQKFIPLELVIAHRLRGLTPDKPVLRGTAQNTDVYFQARETVNSFYSACLDITQQIMDEFAENIGRKYKLFDYYGHPEAEKIIILMGSGCETVHETVDYLHQKGEKVGVIKVRLYRPFDTQRFINSLPKTTRSIGVLDRTKEPGAIGEPLYIDVVTALAENQLHKIKVVGGRYGLYSKEFTPAMVKSVFDNLDLQTPKNHFTVGINDDITHTSLAYNPEFNIESDHIVRAIFYGLGADGTVGANKNSIKIIGEETDNYAQGYFVYDSKKSGSVTISHLRFGSQPIRSTYLITKANFVACHQWEFLEKFLILKDIIPGGTFLLNSHFNKDEVWDKLPPIIQTEIINKNIKFYVINAYKVAREAGMGGHINTVMQVCFFAISGILTREEAIVEIKKSIRKTYSRKGEEIVQMNIQAVDKTLENLHEIREKRTNNREQNNIKISPIPDHAPAFIRDVLGKMIAREGDDLPVSALPVDGTYPTGTSKWEKRNIAEEIPVWDTDVCIQCGKCVMVCPHSVIRAKVYAPEELENAPETFKSTDAKEHNWHDLKFTIQVAAEDCTGCGICVDVCPAKNKAEPRKKAINMAAQKPLREQERENWDFFLNLPNPDRLKLQLNHINQQQMQEPLFEFSGACAGC